MGSGWGRNTVRSLSPNAASIRSAVHPLVSPPRTSSARLKRVFDAHAAVAEGAAFLVEQLPRRRVVQVDRVVVRKHERDPSERVVLAGQLADRQPSADRLHLVAAPAQESRASAGISFLMIELGTCQDGLIST